MNNGNKTYAYIALGLMAAGAAALALIFTPLGIYALIAAVLFDIAALTFLNIQKKKNAFRELKFIIIAAYVLLGVTVAVFAGGIIWSSINS